MQSMLIQLKPILKLVERYQIVLYVLVISLIYMYIINVGNQVVSEEPITEKISENYTSPTSPKINPKTEKKIKELEDRNITFQAIIDGSRQNPF